MDAIAEYMTGQRRPSHPALLDHFEALNREAVQSARCELDLAYGPHPRQRFDFFPAAGAGPETAVLCYFHAGYWQSRDKSGFRFIAPAFTTHGLAVALVNYPLCPEVSLDALLAAAHSSVAAVRDHLRARSGGAPKMILAGHSAGAHIAVELAARDAADSGSVAGISGVVGLSGVYDLRPLIETPLNDNLKLDLASAVRNSPLDRLPANLPPALFAGGGGETPEFIRQTAQVADAWRRTGAPSTAMTVGDDDHFTLLTTLCDPNSALHRAVHEMAG